jgi:hypothetical protein
MPPSTPTAQRHMDAISSLMFQGYYATFDTPLLDLAPLQPTLDYVSSLTEETFSELFQMANTHHVIVRAARVLEKLAIQHDNNRIAVWCKQTVMRESERGQFAVEFLERVCNALESAGCKTTVIKSLDHWPDLGSDLDLYTTGNENTVIQVLRDNFQAELEGRSWGDHLANKWNFKLPGLPELIEVHVGYLGQTGEHRQLARRAVERRVSKTIGGRRFFMSAPEEQVTICTLQRMYRHFYFRLCDMTDIAALQQSNAINFVELRRAAGVGGIWPGVATLLFLVEKYAKSYGGVVDFPKDVLAASVSPDIRVFLQSGFLRVPKLPAAGLYGSQLLNAGLHCDLRALFRLPLLPPLAVSALLAYRITGSDKGVW